MSLAAFVALGKAEPFLIKRLGQLQERLQADDEGAWGDFLAVVQALVALTQATQPENGAPMLTTQEMASRLGVASKTLLRHKKNGKIQPALAKGKPLRWSGLERLG